MSSRKTARRAWWRLEIAAAALISAATPVSAWQYREDFDARGKPAAMPSLDWDYRAELSPVRSWTEIIPGDGYAYLSAEREFLKRGRWPWQFWPFQTLSFGPIGAGNRISMAAKNAALEGLAGMIFTYREQESVDEIDLEIAATDTESRDARHETGPDGGWTDLRMATWIAADKTRPEPKTMVRQILRDANGQPRSLQDDEFHVYTIEWHRAEVRFLVDGVLQHTIDDEVPDRPAKVIFGLRQMPWAGRATWHEPQTMTVDWITVEPLEEEK